MTFTSVYVGKYPTTKICKKDLKKLNELGLKGYLFFIDGNYSIKVASFTSKEKASRLEKLLTDKGFYVFED